MLITLTAAIVMTSAPQELGGVPAALWSHFKTGVNVTRWFCYEGVNAGSAHWQNYLTDADLANFKRLKVTFVRLCVSPDLALKDGKTNAALLPHLDRAIAKLDRAGIATLLDLHDNGQLRLDGANPRTAEFKSFWTDMAKRYNGQRLNKLVFEPVNEPIFREKPDDWQKLEGEIIAIIRKIDAKRTITATSNSWSGVDSFLKLKKRPESNLIYTFHCYDPFFFTHQGATWAGNEARAMKNLPFPSSPELVSPLLPSIEERYRGVAVDYGKGKFDAAYLAKRIGDAAAWGKTNSVPVFLGEFGAYPPAAPVESRARWFAAMRAAVARHRMPNALWGYDDGLGLGRRKEGTGIWLDPLTLKHFYGL
ncbi:MAG TPA: cellulase family glycosylhydrolase [Fimbriimonadaceae bacterium]|nr:cellulase family glycosylhydrolase [Fimbriimonadaceae bacterium]